MAATADTHPFISCLEKNRDAVRQTYSFKFADQKLNQKLISLLLKKQIPFRVKDDQSIHYKPEDEPQIGNELINRLRDTIFKPWQTLSCPNEWVSRYKQYVVLHGIPFAQEYIDDQEGFLLPRKYRPHSWRMDPPAKSNGLQKREPISSKRGGRLTPTRSSPAACC
jgi:hypothetical protein